MRSYSSAIGPVVIGALLLAACSEDDGGAPGSLKVSASGEEAAQALQKVFRLPSNHPDPWFAYIAGDAWHVDSRLKAMRALVTRPPVIRR